MNWGDPEARLALLEAVGPEEYNRQFQQHRRRTVVEVVNGRAIRAIQTRFGRIYMVDEVERGSASIQGARKIARGEL